MGIPRASRKGKKAWRKNIDAQEVGESPAGLLLLLLLLLPVLACCVDTRIGAHRAWLF
jgi:hypothetical protein